MLATCGLTIINYILLWDWVTKWPTYVSWYKKSKFLTTQDNLNMAWQVWYLCMDIRAIWTETVMVTHPSDIVWGQVSILGYPFSCPFYLYFAYFVLISLFCFSFACKKSIHWFIFERKLRSATFWIKVDFYGFKKQFS